MANIGLARFSIDATGLKKVMSQLEPMFKGSFDSLPRVLFKVEDKVVAYATNGEAYTKITFECEIINSGEFVVSGMTLAKIVKQATSDKIELTMVDSEKLSIVVGKTNYHIALVEGNIEYFEAPNFENAKQFSIQAQDLKSGINSVINCIDQTKAHLNAVMIHSNDGENNKVFIVATDGMRLGVCERSVRVEEKIQELMIPKKSAEYIVSIIGDANVDLEVKYTDSLIQINCGGIFYTAKFLDTKFPKYQAVIPTSNNKIFEAKVVDLKNTIKSITQISDISFRIKIALSSDNAVISCEDNGNKAEGSIEATYSDQKPIDIVCNYRLLLELLDKITSSVVRIQIADEQTPLLIRSMDDETTKYVFMPFVS